MTSTRPFAPSPAPRGRAEAVRRARRIATRERHVNNIIYIVGLVVIVVAILSFVGVF